MYFLGLNWAISSCQKWWWLNLCLIQQKIIQEVWNINWHIFIQLVGLAQIILFLIELTLISDLFELLAKCKWYSFWFHFSFGNFSHSTKLHLWHDDVLFFITAVRIAWIFLLVVILVLICVLNAWWFFLLFFWFFDFWCFNDTWLLSFWCDYLLENSRIQDFWIFLQALFHFQLSSMIDTRQII